MAVFELPWKFVTIKTKIMTFYSRELTNLPSPGGWEWYFFCGFLHSMVFATTVPKNHCQIVHAVDALNPQVGEFSIHLTVRYTVTCFY